MTSLQEVTSEESFDTTIQSLSPSTLVVLYFHTPWAAPCAQMKTILTTLASTCPQDSPITFLSINAEDLPEISENHDVTAVPFLVLLRGGKTLETVSGSDAAKVRAAVERHSGPGNAGKPGIPPPLEATPQTNGSAMASKDLNSYAPKDSDPKRAPESSSGQPDKEELNERLAKLVKAAPVIYPLRIQEDSDNGSGHALHEGYPEFTSMWFQQTACQHSTRKPSQIRYVPTPLHPAQSITLTLGRLLQYPSRRRRPARSQGILRLAYLPAAVHKWRPRRWSRHRQRRDGCRSRLLHALQYQVRGANWYDMSCLIPIRSSS